MVYVWESETFQADKNHKGCRDSLEDIEQYLQKLREVTEKETETLLTNLYMTGLLKKNIKMLRLLFRQTKIQWQEANHTRLLCHGDSKERA